MSKSIIELKAENQALRDELEAVKVGMNKIKADAIREALHQWSQCSEKNLRTNLSHHANKVEKGQ